MVYRVSRKHNSYRVATAHAPSRGGIVITIGGQRTSGGRFVGVAKDKRVEKSIVDGTHPTTTCNKSIVDDMPTMATYSVPS